MPCYKPTVVWKPLDGGPISFRELKDHREIKIPCKRCIGCRQEIRDAWAFRCMAESKMHEHNHFITLTYDDDSLPLDECLDHRDWQLFAKRLRKKLGPFRFFMCGEYGEKNGRPHYHALLFGADIPDLVKCNSVFAKSDTFQSDLLNAVWEKGMCVVGTVTHASARYCASYAVKRVSGELSKEHYGWITRYGEHVIRPAEYGKMSLKPGIGATWLERYQNDAYNHGQVFEYSKGRPIPRYFRDLLQEIDPQRYETMQAGRTEIALQFFENNTRERLEVREAIAHAKRKFNNERRNNAL